MARDRDIMLCVLPGDAQAEPDLTARSTIALTCGATGEPVPSSCTNEAASMFRQATSSTTSATSLT